MILFNLTVRKQKLRFWSVIAASIFLSVIGLGAVFQGAQSGVWISMPSLWFFGLIVLPILLYILVRIYLSKQDWAR